MLLHCVSSQLFAGNACIREIGERCVRIGVEGLYLALSTDGAVALDSSAEDCAALCGAASAVGLRIAGVFSPLHHKYRWISGSAPERRAAAQICEALLQRAAWLGASTVRVFPGELFQRGGAEGVVSYEQALQRTLDGVSALIPASEARALTLAVTAGSGGFLLSPVECRQVVDQFHSADVGVALRLDDLQRHGNPADWLRILGRRVKVVSFRGADRPVREGAIPELSWGLAAVRKALRDIRYDSDLVAEPSIPLQQAAAMLQALSATNDFPRT